MDYESVRPKIRSGDLLAWTHRGWGSWYDVKIQAIRVFDRTEYVHVGLAWVVGGRVFVLEAVQPKVRIYPLSKLGEFYWIPMDTEWKPETEEFALSCVGHVYSVRQAILAYFSRLVNDTMWQCAEYARAVLLKEGIDLGERATPSSVVQAAQNMGKPTFLIRP